MKKGIYITEEIAEEKTFNKKEERLMRFDCGVNYFDRATEELINKYYAEHEKKYSETDFETFLETFDVDDLDISFVEDYIFTSNKNDFSDEPYGEESIWVEIIGRVSCAGKSEMVSHRIEFYPTGACLGFD